MNGIGTIISKELARIFKDKKMLFSLFILPIIIVVGIFSLISFMTEKMMEDVEAHIPVAYVYNAPAEFVAIMNQAEFPFTDMGDATKLEQLKDELLSGAADIIVCFADDFKSEVSKGLDELDTLKTPVINVYYNPSEDYSSQALSVMTAIFEGYKQELLGERFGNINAVAMFEVESNEILDEKKATGKVLGQMVPYFITMLIFANAMGLGADMIAGEKERGTLAAMLLTPLKRTNIVLGKVFSLAIISVLSSCAYLVAMIIAAPKMMGNMGVDGANISFNSTQIVQLIVITIGVVLLYVTIISLVAVFSKDIKMATTYLSPVYMIVIVCGMITMLGAGNGATETYKYLIPLYGSSLAYKDILTNEMTMVNFAASAIGLYVCSAVLVVIIAKAFNSEKVMFNA